VITLHGGPLAGQQVFDPPAGTAVVFCCGPRDPDEASPPHFHRYERRGGSWLYSPPGAGMPTDPDYIETEKR
jgi:hypothetical protein